MKKVSTLLLLIIVSCSGGQQTDKEKGFNESLKNVRRLGLPLTFDSHTMMLETRELLKNKAFNQDSLTINPYGICCETDKYFGTIFRASADIFYPRLVTFDRSGNAIDSLFLIDHNENEPSWRMNEHATIFADKTIVLTDSTETWKTDENSNQIPGTHKVDVVKISQYKISEVGKIELQKEDEIYEMGEYLITPKSIGFARLGQTIDAFKLKFKNYDLTTVPVWNYCVDGGGNGILVSKGQEALLFVWTMQGNDSIHSITGLSKKLRTNDGLGPTNSVGQLMKHYPNITLVNDMLCEGLESFRDPDTKIRYEFVSNDSTRIGHYTNENEVSVPYDTSRRLTRITIAK